MKSGGKYAAATTAIIIKMIIKLHLKRHLHDLEGAVGSVEELDLANAPLGDGVEGRATPAPLHQTDGLSWGWKNSKASISTSLKSGEKKQIANSKLG